MGELQAILFYQVCKISCCSMALARPWGPRRVLRTLRMCIPWLSKARYPDVVKDWSDPEGSQVNLSSQLMSTVHFNCIIVPTHRCTGSLTMTLPRQTGLLPSGAH